MQVRRLFVFLNPVFIVETTRFPKLGHMTPASRAHATGVPSSHFPFCDNKEKWGHDVIHARGDERAFVLCAGSFLPVVS